MRVTPTHKIYLMMLVIILVVSACQLRPNRPNPSQADEGQTASAVTAKQAQGAVITATVSSVASLVAEYTANQAGQTTPVVVTVTPGAATTATARPGNIYLSTRKLAEAYMAALVAGNKQEVFSLLTPGAVCTPGNFTENIKRHLDRFSASQVRHIKLAGLRRPRWDNGIMTQAGPSLNQYSYKKERITSA